MTSISQKAGLQPQGTSNTIQAASQTHSPSASISGKTSPLATGSAPAPARPANATKKSFSAVASDASNNAPVTVGGTTQSQHGKAASLSTVNGKPLTQQPAVPSVGGVNIVNGNTMPAPATQGDHSRKPSFTISAAGATGHVPNGSTSSARIQFGSQGSPAAGKPASLAQPQASLDVAQSMNPRTTSPQGSPSPIPQPVLSGGRPPSTLQGQAGPNFGGFDRDSDMNVSYNPVSEKKSNRIYKYFERKLLTNLVLILFS